MLLAASYTIAGFFLVLRLIRRYVPRYVQEQLNELGMRPLAAHCHFHLCKLLRKVPRPEQARQHLTAAATMYREMGMSIWLDQVGDELRTSA